jgi:hypothetical protein
MNVRLCKGCFSSYVGSHFPATQALTEFIHGQGFAVAATQSRSGPDKYSDIVGAALLKHTMLQ